MFSAFFDSFFNNYAAYEYAVASTQLFLAMLGMGALLTPQDFLLEMLETPELLPIIEDLLARKQAQVETAVAPAIPELNSFIEQELTRLEEIEPGKSRQRVGMSELNALFHQVLVEA